MYPGRTSHHQSNGPYANYQQTSYYADDYVDSYKHDYHHTTTTNSTTTTNTTRPGTNYPDSPPQPQQLPDYNTAVNSQRGRQNGTYHHRSPQYDFQDYHNYKNQQQQQHEDYKQQQEDYKQLQHEDYKQLQQQQQQHEDYKQQQLEDYKQLQQLEDYKQQQQQHEDYKHQLQLQEDYKHQQQQQQQHHQTEYGGSYGKHSSSSSRHHHRITTNDLHHHHQQQQHQQQQQFSDSELTVSKHHQQHHHQHPHQQQTMAGGIGGGGGQQQDTGVDVRGLQGLSAGELLGKTHEELVLLLIQLRRHHSALQSARHHSRLERDSQARLAQLDEEHREEHLRRLATLNNHLHDLDKQYEMGKPLINLVDNMVKLGSLYRGGDSRLPPQHDPRQPRSYYAKGFDSLEFSRRVQERRIVAEDLQLQEQELGAADQTDLEGKVMQLYKLDKNLHQESLTIQSLQRQKEMLERTLVTLHTKSHGANEGPVELERRKTQRRHLEHELSKLRAHLAVSARKLEETAAENSRLEHEMMMLRQKIQITMARNCQRESGSSMETRHIESEMVRVQTLLEDLQRRRVELSHQIQKLTSANPGLEMRPSPTGVVSASHVPARRRTHSTWLETDLDAMITRDRGLDPPDEPLQPPPRRSNHPVYVNTNDYVEEVSPNDFSESPDYTTDSDYPPPPPPPEHMRTYTHHHHHLVDAHSSLLDQTISDQPYLHSQTLLTNSHPQYNGDLNPGSMLTLDRNAADNKPDGEEQQHSSSHLDINDADDRMKRYYGILPKEKPLEIKTVRIVKRESTERRKDRGGGGGKRVTIGDSSLTHLLEDDDVESDDGVLSDAEIEPPLPSFAARSASLPRNYGGTGPGERVSMMTAMMRSSVGNSGTMTRPSNLALKKPPNWKSKTDNPKHRPLSAHEQLFGFSRDAEQTPPASPSKSDPPSPVFKSAAAQEIIKEMASEAEKHRRAVPKEKRRHFTISSSRPMTLEARRDGGSGVGGVGAGVAEGARSRDDCDMVRALRPRNHPDVVKSTLSTRDLRFNESTIDNILGAPNKIYIPERYMPDADDEKVLTKEERAMRAQKAESIRKMLSETQTTVTTGGESTEEKVTENEAASGSVALKAKVAAEKKEREHILALNQILARQVMEKSRVVAAHTSAEPHL
ncbi:hypothetical protein Pcinc_033578 [Petrolisthes cinctipes]|uniref:Pleckstrin homology domain-containing protein n=1 Tax=Petrolisthes cinctipes TaxID=88211 RepID=A0AAE1ES02_PETCI|nr:hypothetical protein Pcinc_033578 [Petrolisthes cinctipes]